NGAAAAGLGQNDVLTKECIISVNPDLLLVPTWTGGQLDVYKLRADLENDPALQTVKAIRAKRLVPVPDTYIYCASQDVVQAIRDMMNAAYPELGN
ncbi:MAG TPA: ABC transporter substrate-binding protein, partial [Negativicutes bacterium]|nr:ABC transporter substrate-binding protein [Negativicutes bacterium]